MDFNPCPKCPNKIDVKSIEIPFLTCKLNTSSLQFWNKEEYK